ncbi:MAG: GAF domain-containing sensor histidine kinase [Acidimicrobiia bacterium]
MDRLPATVRQLVEAAALVAGQADLSDVLRTTIRTAMELTGAAYGALGVIGSHGVLTDFIFEGMDRETADRIDHLPVGKGVLGAMGEIPLRLEDLTTHPDAVGMPANHPPMTSFLGVAVRLGSDTIGNLYLTNKADGPFSEEDELLVQALAVIAGSAVSRARLERRLERAALIEDRERIARDIHDGVIQELFAVGLALQATRGTDSAEASERIDQAVDSIDDAMTSLRDYIFDLQSQTPDFEARLRAVLSTAASEADVRIELTGRFVDLDRPIADNLTHFVREAVSNAVRHARPSKVTVFAINDGDTVTVEVVDDGSGFDPTMQSEGMGLANMRERVSVLGGTCEIRSEVGNGTTAIGSVPLE